jgi:hypothetical protein
MRGLIIKFHAFVVSMAIQDIVVMASGMKPVISPTFMQNIWPLKIADTVN